jgi:outer membrane protein OmpA-like peptidoglycan-associated protein
MLPIPFSSWRDIMKSVHSAVSVVLLSLALTNPVFAAGDAKGCADHPLFTRMSGYSIYECKKNYNQLPIKFDNDPKSPRNLKPEGDLTALTYMFTKSSDSPTPPSELQVMRNYQNATKSKGGEVIVDRPGYTALKFKREEKTVYAVVRGYPGMGRIYLDVLEEKAMAQEVTANLMWDALNKDGFIALQINFDTNKAVIKPESLPIVAQNVSLMRNQPALKVSIEGHTDNQGSAAANKTLSLERAKALVAAVAAEGIKADRINYVGWGQERPVADNRTEDGRAKNRRVELVKR